MSTSTSVKSFFDGKTGTVSYVIVDNATRVAAIVDPVLDFDFKSGRTATVQADKVLAYVRDHGLTIQWILETHAHADHLSAARHLQAQVGGRIAIGEHIQEVQATFKKLYNLERSFLPDGRQFDHVFADDEDFEIGTVAARALLVPGHTPADMAYLIGDALFVGDTVFMPDVGTARCDFPGGDAGVLYDSVQSLYQLPDATRVFVCHDYLPAQREEHQWETTLGAQKKNNIHLGLDTVREDFVALRQARDVTLAMPVLILPAIQVNIRAGHLPPADVDGRRFLKIPLDAL